MTWSFPSTLRRRFLVAASAALVARAEEPEPIIDIHQHTDYTGRTDEQLIAHQRKLGVTHTVLLPAGRFFCLEAMCGGNDRVQAVARTLPRERLFLPSVLRGEIGDAGHGEEREHMGQALAIEDDGVGGPDGDAVAVAHIVFLTVGHANGEWDAFVDGGEHRVASYG